MYRDHFRLQQRPFTHGPGERFFSPNASVNEAIERLRHLATARDSVAVVSGGPGVGKSALAEHAFAAVDAARTRIARVDLRFGEGEDLYGAILLALGETAAGPRPMHALHALRETMRSFAAEQKRLVLALDIGGITADLARHLLRVVNLAGESGGQMNLVLMGPHTLHQQVDVPAMIQLRQRIAFRHRVRPLTLAETERYLRHQLEAVGGDSGQILSANVAAAVYCYVAGVPRLINTLLDTTLSEAAMYGLQRPDGNGIRRTAEGLGWKPIAPTQQPRDLVAAVTTPRPASPTRSSPPKVAIVQSVPPAERERRTSEVAQAASGAPTPSEATLQLRAGSTARMAVAATAQVVSLAEEPKSPTAAVFGGGSPSPGAPIMDPLDSGATGMLRLQDLDERFAETIFGRDQAELDKK